jgi:hypothetical protein
VSGCNHGGDMRPTGAANSLIIKASAARGQFSGGSPKWKGKATWPPLGGLQDRALGWANRPGKRRFSAENVAISARSYQLLMVSLLPAY